MALRFKQVTNEEVAALKDGSENLNTRKSTVNWVRLGFLRNGVTKMGLRKNLRRLLLSSWIKY